MYHDVVSSQEVRVPSGINLSPRPVQFLAHVQLWHDNIQHHQQVQSEAVATVYHRKSICGIEICKNTHH